MKISDDELIELAAEKAAKDLAMDSAYIKIIKDILVRYFSHVVTRIRLLEAEELMTKAALSAFGVVTQESLANRIKELQKATTSCDRKESGE